MHLCCLCQQVFPTEEVLSDHLLTHGESVDVGGNQLLRSMATISPSAEMIIKSEEFLDGVDHRFIENYSSPLVEGLVGHKRSSAPCQSPHGSGTSVRAHRSNKRVRNSDTQLSCDMCQKVYTTKTTLAEHVSSAHEGRRLECDNCHSKFTHIGSLRNHNEISQKRYKCDKCPLRFCYKKQYQKHTSEAHHSLEISSESASIPLENLTCNVCQKLYSNTRFLREHVSSAHQGNSFECEKCLAKFPLSDALKA
eukprot:781349_1